MKTTLDIVTAWTALDMVLLAAWHLAHVRSRRLGSRGRAAGTQRVYTVAPDAGMRAARSSLVPAGRD